MIHTFRRAAAPWLLAGLMLVLAGCGGGGGAGSGSSEAPAAVIRATALAVTGTASGTVSAPLGSTLTLDGSASSAQGGVASFNWTVSARPAGSTATIAQAGSAVATFAPDLAGSYSFTLQIASSGGAVASAVLPVTVSTAVPVVNVVTTVDFNAPSSIRPPQGVSLGSQVTLNAAGSTDAGGGPVTLSWALVAAPSGSTAALGTLGSGATSARFTPDLAGAYQVRVRATGPSGLYADAVHTFNATANAPTVAVATSISTVATGSTLNAAVGNLVSLDGGSSVVPAGSVADGTWTLQSRPAASKLSQLTPTSTSAVSFVPDVPGLYALQYALVDRASGSASFHRVQVTVVLGPTAVVSASAAPVAAASGPSYVGAVGSAVTLRGGASYDPTGGVLNYSWALDTRPAGSSASLSDAGTATASFTPDKNGRYGATLTVANAAGLVALQSLSLYVGNFPPVAVLDRNQLMILTGNSVSASAAGSYSQNANTLAFSWALDTRPVGSNASIATPNTATLNFTPDLAGTYYATVTVSDGAVSAVASVSILALSASSGTVPLAYQPLMSRYSKSQGKAVIVSSTPNMLHLVDPVAGTDVGITLPAAVKALSLSADGLLAGVLHEGSVSLVDLAGAQLLRTSSTGGSHTEVFTANSGVLFLTGQTGGQWVSPPFVALNGRTGVTLQTGGSFASIYGTTRGVMSESLGKIFTLSEGLSPADISYNSVNTTTGAFNGGGDSPYHGDYSMANPMWLSADQTLLFTGAGTYFRTADLNYAGSLGAWMISISHSATAAEAVALASNATYYYNGPTQYPEALKRFTGSLLFPAADVRLPMIGGQQTYGLAVFHAADDRRVMVVQTGSNEPLATGLQYFVIVR